MTNGFLLRSVGDDAYVCMICRRKHKSSRLMRQCSHGKEKETKVEPTNVDKAKIIIPFGNLEMLKSKIEGYDLDKLRQMGKDFEIPHAAVKGKDKLVVELLEFFKLKGEF